MEKSIKKILAKGWQVSLTFKEKESFCFIYSKTGRELGFCKTPDPDILETAFNRALQKDRQLDELRKKEEEQQPFLYEEVLGL